MLDTDQIKTSVKSNIKFWQVISIILLLAIISVTISAWQPWRTNTRTVEVTGEGKVKSDPDTAIIYGGVDIKNAVASEAQKQASAQLAKIIEAVKALGVTEKEIQTNNISTTANYNYSASGSTQDGYMGHANITVTLTDVSKGQSVFEALSNNGATNVYGPSLTFSDEKLVVLKRTAEELATQDAKDRAGRLAKASGCRLGKVLSINTSDGGRISPMPFYSGEDKALSISSPESGAISLGSGVTTSTGGGIISSSPSLIQVGQNEVVVYATVKYRLK